MFARDQRWYRNVVGASELEPGSPSCRLCRQNGSPVPVSLAAIGMVLPHRIVGG